MREALQLGASDGENLYEKLAFISCFGGYEWVLRNESMIRRVSSEVEREEESRVIESLSRHRVDQSQISICVANSDTQWRQRVVFWHGRATSTPSSEDIASSFYIVVEYY